MSYNVLQGSYKTSSDTIDFESISIGRFKITQNGVYVGNKQVIDRYGNLLGLNAVSNQISNITTYGMFTGVRQGVPSATLDVAGTGNFMGNVTCASTLSAAALSATGNVSGATGSFGTLTASLSSASLGSFTNLAASGTVTALRLQASTASISSFVCSTISAGTYLGLNPTFVGTGNSLVLSNTIGTHLTLINTTGGGTNSFANLDFSGFSGPTNGAPMTFRFMDDNNFSALLSVRTKINGSPSNGQTEQFNIGSGGVAFTGTSRFATRMSGAGLHISGQSQQYPGTNPFTAGGSVSLLIAPPNSSPSNNVYIGCFTGSATSPQLPEILIGRQIVGGTLGQPYIQMLTGGVSGNGAGPAIFMQGYGLSSANAVNAFFNVDTYQNVFNCSLPTNLSGSVSCTGPNLTVSNSLAVGTINPAYTVDVKGNGRFTATGSNQIFVTNPGTANNQDACEIGFDRSAGTSTARSAIGVGAGGRNAYWWVNGSDRITIDPNGRVGVNIQAPQYTLDVNGTFHCNFLYANGGSLSGLYNFGQNDNNALTWGPNTNSKIVDNGDLRIATDDSMHFYTGCNNNTYGTEYLTIANGCVGVNRPSPVYQLDIVGSFRTVQGASYVQFNGGYCQFYRADGNAGDGLVDYYSDVGGASTNIARLSCNGNWNTKTGSYNTLSDRRKKKNICDARRYLDSLCKLRVRKYSWQDSDDAENKPTQLGFVAQEIEEIMPGLIDTIKVDDIDDFKCVKSSILVPMLVSAVQELQQRLQAVERLLPQASA